jgi:hypothetical protein
MHLIRQRLHVRESFLFHWLNSVGHRYCIVAAPQWLVPPYCEHGLAQPQWNVGVVYAEYSKVDIRR